MEAIGNFNNEMGHPLSTATVAPLVAALNTGGRVRLIKWGHVFQGDGMIPTGRRLLAAIWRCGEVAHDDEDVGDAS